MAIQIGNIVLARAGVRVATGDGTSGVDEAPLIGESVALVKELGSPVYAGSFGVCGGLLVRIRRMAADSKIAPTIHPVEEEQASGSSAVRSPENRSPPLHTPAFLYSPRLNSIPQLLTLIVLWALLFQWI